MNNLLLSFCVNDMIEAQALIAAAKKTNTLICLMITENAIAFAGYNYLLGFLKEAKQELEGKVIIELDHGKHLDLITQCINDGFDLVMFDGSELPIDENIRLTKQVVALAHAEGVKVEGAIGKVGDLSKGKEKVISELTNVKQAQEFVSQTNIDYLAISVGNVHGNLHKKPQLQFDLIQDLTNHLPCPLVLHGADFIDDSSLQGAIQQGIKKINFGPELRNAYWQALIEATKLFISDDPREAFKHTRQAVQKVVKKRIKSLL